MKQNTQLNCPKCNESIEITLLVNEKSSACDINSSSFQKNKNSNKSDKRLMDSFKKGIKDFLDKAE